MVALSHVLGLISRWLGDDKEGQGMVEYGLIIALVAIVAVVGLLVLGPAVRDLLSQAGTSI